MCTGSVASMKIPLLTSRLTDRRNASVPPAAAAAATLGCVTRLIAGVYVQRRRSSGAVVVRSPEGRRKVVGGHDSSSAAIYRRRYPMAAYGNACRFYSIAVHAPRSRVFTSFTPFRVTLAVYYEFLK